MRSSLAASTRVAPAPSMERICGKRALVREIARKVWPLFVTSAYGVQNVAAIGDMPVVRAKYRRCS